MNFPLIKTTSRVTFTELIRYDELADGIGTRSMNREAENCDAGMHARAAVGMSSLPFNMAVEIDMIVEVSD